MVLDVIKQYRIDPTDFLSNNWKFQTDSELNFKKSLAQEVRQKSDTSKRTNKSWPYFTTRPLGHCATCKESSYTKNEYNLFYQKLDAEYFLFNNFLEKNSIFWENHEKVFWKHI